MLTFDVSKKDLKYNLIVLASAEEEWIFKSPQTVRNCVNKAEKNGLVIKDAKNKKVIMLNPTLKIQTQGTIFLDYKFLANDTQENGSNN